MASRKKKTMLSFEEESITVYNKDHDSLGMIISEGGDAIFFEPHGICVYEDELRAIADKIAEKTAAAK